VEIVEFQSCLYIKPRKLRVIRYLDIFLPLLILYKTSTNPLLILYQTSTKPLLKGKQGEALATDIPALGAWYSHVGNMAFPHWE